VPLLGELPLDRDIRQQCDEGVPAVASDPASKVSEIYLQIATRVAQQLGNTAATKSVPNISISDD
jgi:ATP-binding protein involved in chromosome partitioning